MGKLKVSLIFFAGAVVVVLGTGALYFVSVTVFFSLHALPRWFLPVVAPGIWLAQLALGYWMARKSFPVLRWRLGPERQAMTLLIGMAGLLLAIALVLALAPGVVVSNRPFL